MPLCSICQSIDIIDIPKLSPDWNRHHVGSLDRPSLVDIDNRRLWQEKKDGTFVAEPLGHAFHQSLDELETAAKECAICATIYQDIPQFQIELRDAQQDQSYGRPEEGGPDWKMYLARGVNDTGGFVVVSIDIIRPFRLWVLAAVELCVDYDDPLESLIRGRKAQDPSSFSKTLTHALSWLRECDDKLADTLSNTDGPLPTRVLDLISEAPGGVALCRSEGMTGRYAALSHVWGDVNPFTTSQANLEAHTEGIRMEQLPKTFSDTVMVTRKMGIRYLWIDALCICQDDETDWGRETARLSSVYANAYIVISATGTEDTLKGLTTKRIPPDYQKFEYRTKGLVGNIYISNCSRTVATMPGMEALLRDEPLSQRAWAVQERWLAPRVLHFGTKQMFFECDAFLVGEHGYRMQGRSETFRKTAHSGPFQKKVDTDPRDTWVEAINACGNRKLTRSSDKLPVLSEFARAVAEEMNDTYVAGMWRSTLPEALVWRALGRTSAVSEYRVPSWSWAAIDGPTAQYHPGMFTEDGVFGKGIPVATILDCQVKLKGDNPYGEITSAHLQLKAPIEPLTPGDEEITEGFPHRQKGPRMRTDRGVKKGTWCVFDTPQHVIDARGQSLYVVVVLRNESESVCGPVGAQYTDYHGIIVAPVEGEKDTYRRFGNTIMDPDVLGECEWMDDESKMSTFILV